MQVGKKNVTILEFENSSGPTTSSALQITGITGNSYEISIGPIINGTQKPVQFCVAMFSGNCAANPQSANLQPLYLNPDPVNVQSPGPTNYTTYLPINPGETVPGWTVTTQTALVPADSIFAEGFVQGGPGGTIGFSPINAFHDYPDSVAPWPPGRGPGPCQPPMCPPEGYCLSFQVGHDSQDCTGTTLSVAQITDPKAEDVDPILLNAVKHLPQAKRASAVLSFGPERITPPPPSLRWRSVGSLQRTGALSTKAHAILRGNSTEDRAIDRDMLRGEIHQCLLRAEVEAGAVAVFKVSHISKTDGTPLGWMSLVLVGGPDRTGR